MRISYNKLWKMLIDKNMKKSDLKEKAGISSASLAKLGKGDNIKPSVMATTVIEMISPLLPKNVAPLAKSAR